MVTDQVGCRVELGLISSKIEPSQVQGPVQPHLQDSAKARETVSFFGIYRIENDRLTRGECNGF